MIGDTTGFNPLKGLFEIAIRSELQTAIKAYRVVIGDTTGFNPLKGLFEIAISVLRFASKIFLCFNPLKGLFEIAICKSFYWLDSACVSIP